ncbi:hypothetical protein JDF658_20250 [Carboxydocella sp. JDF658]|nr:hypothetical protein JDF658_20250 [Carboxydocella sp. JDF658]
MLPALTSLSGESLSCLLFLFIAHFLVDTNNYKSLPSQRQPLNYPVAFSLHYSPE